MITVLIHDPASNRVKYVTVSNFSFDDMFDCIIDIADSNCGSYITGSVPDNISPATIAREFYGGVPCVPKKPRSARTRHRVISMSLPIRDIKPLCTKKLGTQGQRHGIKIDCHYPTLKYGMCQYHWGKWRIIHPWQTHP